MTTAEIDLLIALSSPGDADAAVNALRGPERIDWNRLLLQSLWHKVAFLALERLRELCLIDESLASAGLPLLLLNHWKQLSAVNTHRNVVMLDELRSISQALESQGVRYVVGKGGPLLIGRCYRSEERKMYDLDLLAPRDELEAIRAAMAQAGYQLANYSHDRQEIVPVQSRDLRKWLLLARGLPNFLRATGDPLIEIVIAQVQFRIGSTGESGRSVSAERLLDRRERLPIVVADPYSVWAPDHADTLVQLALHIARETLDPEHDDWGMSWNLVKFCDLARFAELGSVSPTSLAERIHDLGLGAECDYALSAVDLLFPSEALKSLIESIRSHPGHRAVEATFRLSRSAIVDRMDSLTAPRHGPASRWTEFMGTKST